jgi:uncharacterized protein (TIGR03435 family)
MMRWFSGVALFAFLSGVGFGQSTPDAAAPAAFEIADVRVSPHRAFPFMDGPSQRGDRYIVKQATIVDLIANAYGVDVANVTGGPSWLETDRFDIVAKAPLKAPSATQKLMLQALLAERFGLKMHKGSMPMPAYVLTAPKGKPKMTQGDGGESHCEFVPPPANLPPGTIVPLGFACKNMTMGEFADSVHQWANGYLTEPVVNSTGLEGGWDFDIKWTGRGQLARAGADGISVFDAVEKQMGLKLELLTAPRPVWVVDSVNEKPTPNVADIEKRLPPPPAPQFDVAVIKPSNPNTTGITGNVNAGVVDLKGATLKFMIAFAWDLNPNDNEVLAGAPKWLDENRFDIMAKVTSDPQGGKPRISQEELQLMLRALLIERFKIQSHTEDRPITAYTLLAGTPKMKVADPASRTHCKEGPGPDGKDPRVASPVLNRLQTCQNMTTAQISEELQHIASGYIYGPVMDATGIKGSFDFTLSFSSADLTKASAAGSGSAAASGAAASGASDPNGALSLFDAVSKQLGLKLEKQRRPVPVLVLDHVEEKPTEN